MRMKGLPPKFDSGRTVMLGRQLIAVGLSPKFWWSAIS